MPLRIAIIGAGDVGTRHAGVIDADPNLSLVAVVDPSPRNPELKGREGVAYYAQDYQTMLDRERPDGVVVATPTPMHFEMALACIERKVPTLVEKPITDSVAKAMQLASAAARLGVPVLVGHHRRYNGVLAKAKEFISNGGIGRLNVVVAYWIRRKPDGYFDRPWRREPGGGPLMINAIHDVDCLRFLCGEIVEVHTFASNATRGFAVEDSAVVLLRFENGAIGTFTISDAAQAPWAWELCAWENAAWYAQQPVSCYKLAGTHGSLTVPTLEHWFNENDGDRGDLMQRRRLHVVPLDPHVEQWRHFARVIRGEETPIVDAMEGARTLAVTLAIIESASNRVSVDVADLLAS